jgi:hypothetical protein
MPSCREPCPIPCNEVQDKLVTMLVLVCPLSVRWRFWVMQTFAVRRESHNCFSTTFGFLSLLCMPCNQQYLCLLAVTQTYAQGNAIFARAQPQMLQTADSANIPCQFPRRAMAWIFRSVDHHGRVVPGFGFRTIMPRLVCQCLYQIACADS